MDMQTLKILLEIQNTAHALHGLLDQLTKQATEYVGDADLASDFVGGVVGILEVEKELENPDRKPWRERTVVNRNAVTMENPKTTIVVNKDEGDGNIFFVEE